MARVALLVGVIAAFGAAVSGSAAAPLRRPLTLRTGQALFVPSINVVCVQNPVKAGETGLQCEDNDPAKSGDIRPNSMTGDLFEVGDRQFVAVIFFDKHYSAHGVWRRSQPSRPPPGAFPAARGSGAIKGGVGDGFKIAGTNWFCQVEGPSHVQVLCAVVNVKTLEPVLGSYLVDVEEKQISVQRVTGTNFVVVTGYRQPWAMH